MKDNYHEQKLFEIIKKGKFSDNNCFEWSGSFDRGGYGITTFSPNQIKKTWKVHRLMFYLLKGDIPPNTMVCHLCDNPKCFNVCHLILGSAKLNALDRERKGRGRTQNQNGEKNRSSKFSEKIVLEIRKLYSEGKRVCELVKIFNIPQATISKIITRQRWKHI